MILVDMNQTMISNLMAQIKSSGELNENFMRHMVLNSIKSYEKKFSSEYGEMVLCYDSRKYWRREFFPFYKQNRKKDREKSGLDWDKIFGCLNEIRDEIKEFFPYKVIEVDGAEADDIISVMCKRHHNNAEVNKVLILSGDKDFVQLQKYSFVVQYNPILKKFIRFSRSEVREFINEHVLKGDRSDGIPNILSPDDTFVSGKRQRPLSKKLIASFLTNNPDDICDDEQYRNLKRNKTLIDFDYIPEYLSNEIIAYYESLNTRKKSVPLEYFRKYQLNDLMTEFCFSNSNLPWLKK
jgi:5'-3' exonuclease